MSMFSLLHTYLCTQYTHIVTEWALTEREEWEGYVVSISQNFL